jgi:hypothetical protein
MNNSHIFLIKELKKQLLTLGYYPFQLDEIIKDATGTSNIENINSARANYLISSLKFYIKFSSKCSSSTKKEKKDYFFDKQNSSGTVSE